MTEWAARCPIEGCGQVVVTKGHAYGIRLETFKAHARRAHRNLPVRAQTRLAELLFEMAVQNGLSHDPRDIAPR
jgi:hypothetical protein